MKTEPSEEECSRNQGRTSDPTWRLGPGERGKKNGQVVRPGGSYDAAPNGAQFVAGDDLHELPAPEPETAAKPEPFGRTIDNQARNPLRHRTEVDDHAGSLPRGNPFRAASFVRGEGGHSFVLDGGFPQDPHY